MSSVPIVTACRFHSGKFRKLSAILVLALMLSVAICIKVSRAQTDVFGVPYPPRPPSESVDYDCRDSEEREELARLFNAAEEARRVEESADRLRIEANRLEQAAAQDKKVTNKNLDEIHAQAERATKRFSAALEKYKTVLGNYQERGKIRVCRIFPQLTPSQELHLIIEILKNSGQLGLAEVLAATGKQTFGSTDRVDPLGAGIGVGYYFRPWNNAARLGPFASFDLLNQTINHTFPAGTFIGTQSHWIATVGVKAGLMTTPGVLVYGLTGAALLNQDLNINFGGPITSQNVTTPGFTLGMGGEFRPAFAQGFGLPVSIFVQYQHTWWQDAHLNQPAASPPFNYTFRREDDTVKFGVNIYFGGLSSVEPARPMIVKAPSLK